MTDIDLATTSCPSWRGNPAATLDGWERRCGSEVAHDCFARDRESEAAIVTFIRDHCPEDAILGEEGASAPRGPRRHGSSDPLDGTSNYLQHFPMWSISIAVKTDNEITAGVVHEPLRDLFFTARAWRPAPFAMAGG